METNPTPSRKELLQKSDWVIEECHLLSRRIRLFSRIVASDPTLAKKTLPAYLFGDLSKQTPENLSEGETTKLWDEFDKLGEESLIHTQNEPGGPDSFLDC